MGQAMHGNKLFPKSQGVTLEGGGVVQCPLLSYINFSELPDYYLSCRVAALFAIKDLSLPNYKSSLGP